MWKACCAAPLLPTSQHVLASQGTEQPRDHHVGSEQCDKRPSRQAPVPRMNRPAHQPSRSFYSAISATGDGLPSNRVGLREVTFINLSFSQTKMRINDSCRGANNCLLAGPQRVGTHAAAQNFPITSLATIVYARTLFPDIALLCLGGSHG